MKMKHNNKGFSLVELIVVIAIMAILAGVGTVGYTKYIEQTNKKADMALVGNVMRAAEHSSYLFELNNPLQMSEEGLALPLGFVVLTDNGMIGMESGSELETFVPEDNPCKLLSIGTIPSKDGTYRVLDIPQFKVDGTIIKEEHIVYGNKSNPQAYYVEPYIYNGSGTYCYTCSLRNGGIYSGTKSALLPPSNEKFTEWKTNPNSYVSGERVREHFIFIDSSKLVTSGCVNGQVRPIQSYNKFDTNDQGKIAQMMFMAFGDDYRNVTLKSNWNTTELNTTLPTLYANADKLLTDIESMVTNALNNENFGHFLKENINATMEWLLPGVADKYANTFTKEEYVKAWENLANDNGPTGNQGSDMNRWGGYFGYTVSDLTNTSISKIYGTIGNKAGYIAGVGAYNAGFASYIRSTKPISGTQHKTEDVENCASAIVNYGDKSEYGSTDDFNDAVPVYAAAFADGGKLECPACESLLTQYLENEAWKPNAETFYDLMKTVDDTSVQAITESKLMDESYFDWYKNYISEFQNFYGTLDGIVDNAESAIVIMFHRNPDNTIGFNVFPEEANPRNK